MSELNWFTRQSIERMEALKRQSPRSIHPNGRRGVGSTSKGKSPATIARVRAAIEAHMGRHPNDGVSAGHLAKLG